MLTSDQRHSSLKEKEEKVLLFCCDIILNKCEYIMSQTLKSVLGCDKLLPYVTALFSNKVVQNYMVKNVM